MMIVTRSRRRCPLPPTTAKAISSRTFSSRHSPICWSHIARAEAIVASETALLVRAAQDPGSSPVHNRLLSVMTGNTLFSARLPHSAKLSTYGELMTTFKQNHNATIVAVADDVLGNGLSLNASASKHVGPDQVIYYIAERRIAQM